MCSIYREQMRASILFFIVGVILVIFAAAGGYFLGTHPKSGGSVYMGAIANAFEDTFQSAAKNTEVEIPLDVATTPPAVASDTEKNVPLPLPRKTAPAVTAKKPAKKISPVKPKKTAPVSSEATSSPTSTPPQNKKSPERWCDWKTFGVPSGDVLVNEIAWMGSEDDANAEWMELKNVSGRDVDLSGFELFSRDKKITIALQPTILHPGEFYLLERDSDDAAPDAPADQIYSGALSNSGVWLKLFAPDCRFVDEVDAPNKWPAGSASAKKTMERKVGVSGWQTSDAAGGTPREQNFIPPAPLHSGGGASSAATSTEATIDTDESAPAPSAKVVIAKVQITGSATDDDRIALYNPNADSVDVTGWKIRKRTKSGSESSIKVLSGEIPPSGYFVWANSKHPDGADATSTQTLSADNSAALLDPDDTVMDAVAWGSGHTNPFVEGSTYPANPAAGQFLSRKFSGDAIVDTGNNAEDFIVQ
jgi:hypothetical protein